MPLRVLYSRDHTTVWPGLGVFLAGPTPPEEQMLSGWRRVIIERLKADPRLDARMVVVAPEPESASWAAIERHDGPVSLNRVHNKQIPWEWQYLRACDITAFWLPTYWQADLAEPFAANIGPTSRWEFGFYFQEYLRDPLRRSFIVGGPEDAEGVKWVRRLSESYRLEWHHLAKADKSLLVADSFIEAIVQALLKGAGFDTEANS
ncbi:MAG TPA: hypothetical protein V6D23_19895 [Candidatus Obscuribacterales bacterium]